MTRRDLLTIPAGLSLAGAARAQKTYPGTAYRDYSRCLPDYLRGLAKAAYERRNAEIVKLTSPDAIRRRQVWARETFWQLVGGMPDRSALNIRQTGVLDRPGYQLEKIVYESVPGLHISANLYLPKTGSAPYPAVLFQMGHTLNGKASDLYQKCCQALATLGFIVLAFDPMGQGERVYYPRPGANRTRLRSADDEHTHPGKQMLLNGDSSARFQVWDAIRSVDVLAAHPKVDPKRMASTGQSGGGTLTMLLMAVDDRLAAAAPSCPNTENIACADFNPPGSTDDAEQNFPGGGPLGFDRWDTFYPFAPKPLMVTVSDKDFFGTYSPRYISNGWEEYGKLAEVYQRLGAKDRISWHSTPLPHGISYDLRMHMYNFMRRYLQGRMDPLAEEPQVTPEPEREIWASESGNVVVSLKGETPFSLNRKRSIATDRKTVTALVNARAGTGRATVLGRTKSAGVEIEALEVASDPGAFVPAWLFLPAGARRDPPILMLHPAGRNAEWGETALCQSLARRGHAVCTIDVRGIGDAAAEFSRGAQRHARSHAEEEDYAWASLVLGEPLLTQRVRDVLAVVNALAAHLSTQRIKVAARGVLTVPALFAAALEPRIAELYLAGGLISYRSIVETEDYSHPFANFLPGILAHTDLPVVVASLAPRRIVLAGPVDAADRPAPADIVAREYAAAHITVRERLAWDVESLT
jgi:cephalosporin-C deacetylase-like acetyl esterase